MGRFRLHFADDDSTLFIEADDFDDDGEQISLYVYVPFGGDPLAEGTRKEVIAAFDRESLTGPPQLVS